MDNLPGDWLGPQSVVRFYNDERQTEAFLVIDNLKRGPGKGGVRITPTVTLGEVTRLARTMTLKTALAGLPFGGAKAAIIFDPKKSTPAIKRELLQWFGHQLRPFVPKYYIAGPDISTTADDMAKLVKGAGSRRAATGKPASLGGLPHELGSTGCGVAEAAKLALTELGLAAAGATVAIDGFGNVGRFVAQFLSAAGAKIVAVSDSRGTIYQPTGLDYAGLQATKNKTGSVVNYPGGQTLGSGKIFTLPVSLLVPAALPDVINSQNMSQVKARVIVEGANIAVTPEAGDWLHQHGQLVIPDIVANAGGVISSYAEHRGWGEKKMFALVKQKITESVTGLLRQVKRQGLTPRELALKRAYAILKS